MFSLAEGEALKQTPFCPYTLYCVLFWKKCNVHINDWKKMPLKLQVSARLSLISMALLEFACPFCKSTCTGKIASSEPLGRGYACLASACIMQSKQGDGEDIVCLQEQHWAEDVYCKCIENFFLAYLFSNKAPSLQHCPES